MNAIFDSIPNAEANIQRGLSALERVLRDKTTVHRAMYREGLGWIDFVWGDEGKWPPNAKGLRKGGKGISHAIEARQRKDGLTRDQSIGVLRKAVHAIAEGKETDRIEFGRVERVIIGKDGTEVHLIKRPGSNGWVLTVFEEWGAKLDSGAPMAGADAYRPTLCEPTQRRLAKGALSMAADAIDLSLDRATHPDSYGERLPVGAASTVTVRQNLDYVKRGIPEMPKTTPLIRYNLKERGRNFSGQPRNFNIKAIMDAVNSPECQERVSSRGMTGYYGHAPRIRYGMRPVEGVLDSGKYVPVEPAFVTTLLKAYPDGTIEHQAEFLDTAAGQLAAKLWDSKLGGFSSAIDAGKPEFFGLDYVIEPNYLQNSFRGVVLDDIGSMTYDSVYAEELNEQTRAMQVVLDSMNAERAQANDVIERLMTENEHYLSMLAAKGIDAGKTLDSAFVRPLVIDTRATQRIEADRKAFHAAKKLPVFIAPTEGETFADSSLYQRMLNGR